MWVFLKPISIQYVITLSVGMLIMLSNKILKNIKIREKGLVIFLQYIYILDFNKYSLNLLFQILMHDCFVLHYVWMLSSFLFSWQLSA